MRNSMILGIALLAPLSTIASDDGPIKWRKDFTKAAIEAQQTNKLLVISVHASWCGPCKEMDRTTFKDARLAELLNRDCVPLSLDGDAHKKLMTDWGVTHYPTQMFVGSSGALRGKVLHRLEGRAGVAEYLEALQRCQRKLALSAPKSPKSDPDVLPVSATMPARAPITKPTPDEADHLAEGKAVARMPEAPPKKMPKIIEDPIKSVLALDGYCPVTMVERNTMTPGKASESAVYKGKRYHFATPEHKQAFVANPAKFLPGAAGDCVVSLLEENKQIPGSTKYPAIYADKVFFLSDSAKRDKFLREPERYVDDKGEPKQARPE